jgi:hypothetical protein
VAKLIKINVVTGIVDPLNRGTREENSTTLRVEINSLDPSTITPLNYGEKSKGGSAERGNVKC